jgi:pyruvate-ferredoxin/flavodoxin oxidoreductase
MAERNPGRLAWLQGWWRRSTQQAEVHPGGASLADVEGALAALEAQICEGVVHRAVGAASAALAARSDGPGRPGRNLFGRPVHEETAAGIGGAVAAASGMTLAGLRTTAFLGGDELPAAREELSACAGRLVPLVLHATLGDAGQDGYGALAGSGAFQLLASSGQEALDWSLVARWLAERALLPGLVATDVSAVESLELPDEAAIRSYLGRPDEPIISPTEAQRLLFGRERPRLLPWFDPDRPVATGGLRGAREAARARLARQTFFRDDLPELARRAMEEWSGLSGRKLSFVQEHGLEDAQLVLVGQGAVVPAARAVAEHLRRTRRLKVGVLGITWLRPFPAAELARALEGRRAVAVVETLADPPDGAGPLHREVAAALTAAEGWVSAIAAPAGPEPSALVALCERLARPDPPRRVHLERLAGPATTGFPRRDALLQSVANAYPTLAEADLPDAEPPDPTPEHGRSVGLLGRESELPPDALTQLAESLAADAGAVVRGCATRPAPGAWQARVRAAPADFPDPGPQARVGLLWVTTDDTADLGASLAAVESGGCVLISSGREPDPLWCAIPSAWRQEVRAGGLRLLAVRPGFAAGLEALRACLDGEEAAALEDGRLRELPWRELASPEAADRELPRLVERIAKARPAHDSLPRFWGEVVQPRQAGEPDALPDPLSASGVVPAGASGLEPAAQSATLPELDASACSGCGRCWSVCPDSAIGATALGVEPLLTAASQLAGTHGAAADALRRAHRHLAGHLGSELAKDPSGGLDSERCRSAWDWLVTRLKPSDEERPAYDAAFAATLGALEGLEPMATPPLFHEPEREQKGAGALLVLAVDPRACLGCGLCAAECPEDALRLEDRTPERVRSFDERWRAWEDLPDTAGETLARAAAHPELGPLAAVLLSRHCGQAQLGGSGGEPGSGERLGARWVAAAVEHHGQRSTARLLESVERRRAGLEEKLRARLAEGLSGTDLDTLRQALAGVEPGRADLSELGGRLEALGSRATFDRAAVVRMTRLAAGLDAYRERLAEGLDGLGRARFGVLVARGPVADWAARFPRHPYFAPLSLAPTLEGVELARGIARGLVAEHLGLVRSLRRAAVEADSPPDRSERLAAIDALGWEDLEPEERAPCPPLLLLGDDTALLEPGFEALARLLDSELPVKLVLLDGRGRLAAGPEPTLVAMAHRRAFVLAASLAHPEQMAQGMAEALAWSGPALVHLHAPSPRRHGFAPDETLERARLAVEGRAHVLLRYDPSAEGHFGLRASLEGNPGLEEDWGGASFAAWAAGEARFASHFEPVEAAAGPPLAEWLALPESQRRDQEPVLEIGDRFLAVSDRMARAALERLGLWHTLRELTGGASPFTDRIRALLGADLEAARRAEIEALASEHERRSADARAAADREAVDRLTERLLTLSGFGTGAAPKGNGA